MYLHRLSSFRPRLAIFSVSFMEELIFVFKEDTMKIKNPIRTYLNWYGRNCVEIAAEPAGKALVHYGKFVAQQIAASFAIYAVVCGAAYVGTKIYDKFEEMKED